MDINNLWSEYDLNSKKQNTRCLAVNTILEGKYLVGPVLGQGGFGITYVGYDLNMETKIAIKEYFPVELVSRDTTTMHGDRVLSLSGEKSVIYKQGLKKYVAEAQHVSQFSEIPGVVSVKDFFYANETAYIVMEFIDGISLKDYLKQKSGRLTEEETLKIMKPVLEALVQVHKSGIIHRDISPDNIMLTFKDGNAHNKIDEVKLIDFGAARMTEKNDQKSLTIILKHGYAPEEQYRTHGEQGSWTDVYALCVVLYRMLTGETPVPAMDRMFKDELKTLEQCGVKVNGNTANAILKGLSVKKDERIQSISELIGALYEGKKNNNTVGSGKSRKKKIGLFVGISVAVMSVCMAGVMVLYGNKNSSAQNGHGVMAESDSIAQEKADINLTDGMMQEELLLDVNGQEDEIGEQIVWPKMETMLAVGDSHILSLREDGTVWAIGDNYRGECEVDEWENIAAVYASDEISAGLRIDGTVLITGNAKQEWVDSWSGIVELAVGHNHIIGLTEDGKVLSAGSDNSGSCDTGDWSGIEHIYAGSWSSIGITEDGMVKLAGVPEGHETVAEEVRQWKDITQLSVRWTRNPTYYGVQKDGTVLVAGERATDDESEAVINESNIMSIKASDNVVAGLKSNGMVVCSHFEEVENWTDIISLAVMDYGIVGLKSDGTFVTTGVSQNGNRTAEEILSIDNAVQAVFADVSLYILCDDGSLRRLGRGYYGGNKNIEELEWNNIEKVDNINEDRLLALTKEGKLKFREDGIGHDGTLDRETLMKRIEMTPKLAESWNSIKDFACSSKHVVALFEDGTVKAAGYPKRQDCVDYQTGLSKDGACEVYGWTDICQVVALTGITIGLKTDGTLVFAGDYPESWDEWKKYNNIVSIWGEGTYVGNRVAAITEDGKVLSLYVSESRGQGNTATWEDVIALSLGESHMVGLRKDGTVYATGSNFCGQCDVDGWTGVVEIAAGSSATIGITSEGKVLMAGIMPKDIQVVENWEALPLDVIIGEK